MSLQTEVVKLRRSVRSQDRVWDLSAAGFVVGGMILFAFGRQALNSLADGTYPAPVGESWVARADLHTAQTRWGIWLIVAGVVLASVSALRHTVYKRSTR